MKVIRLNTSAAAAGTISMGYLKDPTSPTWNRDPAVRLYRQIMRRYLPGRKASDVYHYYGMAVAHSMVHALRKSGRNLSRAGLQRAVTHLNQTDNPSCSRASRSARRLATTSPSPGRSSSGTARRVSGYRSAASWRLADHREDSAAARREEIHN